MPDEQDSSDQIIPTSNSSDGSPAEGKGELQLGPESHRYFYDPPIPCPECGGAGSIVLLVTARACKACNGSAKIWPEPRHEHTPPVLGHYRRERTFDAQGRVIVERQWFEPAEGLGGTRE